LLDILGGRFVNQLTFFLADYLALLVSFHLDDSFALVFWNNIADSLLQGFLFDDGLKIALLSIYYITLCMPQSFLFLFIFNILIVIITLIYHYWFTLVLNFLDVHNFANHFWEFFANVLLKFVTVIFDNCLAYILGDRFVLGLAFLLLNIDALGPRVVLAHHTSSGDTVIHQLVLIHQATLLFINNLAFWDINNLALLLLHSLAHIVGHRSTDIFTLRLIKTVCLGLSGRLL